MLYERNEVENAVFWASKAFEFKSENSLFFKIVQETEAKLNNAEECKQVVYAIGRAMFLSVYNSPFFSNLKKSDPRCKISLKMLKMYDRAFLQAQKALLYFLCFCKFRTSLIASDVARMIGKMVQEAGFYQLIKVK
jgi:hypothetical protein